MKHSLSRRRVASVAGIGAAVLAAIIVSDTNAATVPTANLELWLDAGAGVTSGVDGVSTWADQSGNGNHAVQANTTRQPTPVASTAAFNNQPTIQFNGSSDVMQAPLSLNAVGGFTLYIVAQYPSVPTGKTLLGGTNSNYGGAAQQFLLRADESSNNALSMYYDSGHNGATALGTADTNVHIQSFVYDGGAQTLTYAIDDNSTTVSANFVNISLFTLDIAAYVHLGTPYEFSQANIAEILVYGSALSSGDQASIAEYLGDKYTAVPEPSAFAFIGMAGSALLIRKRRSN